MSIDTATPLPLMVVDDPHITAAQTTEPPLIVISFQTVRVETKESNPIALCLMPRHAAMLLNLLQDLRGRGLVPEIGGQVSETRHRQH
jgi:hypothetical protein